MVENMRDNLPALALVIPCFNEEQVLPTTAPRLSAQLDGAISAGLVSEKSRIYFIDDGSTDDTWRVIAGLVDADKRFRGIKLTRNYGHQYALFAGLMEADADIYISMDADLQDDLTVIDNMIQQYHEGSEIVFGVRDDRKSDTAFKRWTANLHYWLSGKLGIEVVKNHADFRLMSHRAVAMLGRYQEANLYLRGIVPLLGLKTSRVYYRRERREAGESKYSLVKMLSLAVHGVTSFSIMPLRIIMFMGVLIFGASMVMGAWTLGAAIWSDDVVPGWASTVIPTYLLGGFQLLAIGVAGEYIGKTYIEVKQRPRYLIDKSYQNPDENIET